MANFVFSSKLPDAEREDAIFRLNRDVYTTESSLSGLAANSIATLIQGWYNDKVTASNVTPQFNPDYIPTVNGWPAFQDAYANGYAHSCRTCHVAMEKAAFEVDAGLLSGFGSPVCVQHLMPNSKVTLNRFWLSAQPGITGQPSQPPGGQPHALFSLIGCETPP
jgi:hypothetical protein